MDKTTPQSKRLRNRESGRELRTITVAELIEALENEAPDALVVFACDYGDYHHTEQALGVKGEIEEIAIVPSAYSHSGFAVAGEPDADDEEAIEPAATYLVIR